MAPLYLESPRPGKVDSLVLISHLHLVGGHSLVTQVHVATRTQIMHQKTKQRSCPNLAKYGCKLDVVYGITRHPTIRTQVQRNDIVNFWHGNVPRAQEFN